MVAGAEVEAVVHNSPALDSLKHQQLRSLCARHGLKSTGKRDHLIKRLKALRDRPAHVNNEEACSSEQDGLDGSFDIVDDEESEEAQFNTLLPGSFESSSNTTTTTARPSIMSSRVSTDEFGALSADATTISRSSSWKDKLASVFGGASSSAGSMSTSSSSDSLASIRTARGGGDNNNARANSTSAESSLSLQQYTSTSSHVNFPSAPSTSTLDGQCTAPAPAPPSPAAAPAFRIVEDSFIQANSTYPDCSFVPRSSFEGNSIDLANAVVWPPPPGVILISPRQSPNKAVNEKINSSSRISTSAQKKRYLEDVEEDYDEDEDGGRYGSIRLIPKMQLESVTASSSTTPGRRIARMPKRMSVIASSPPRFDLEAPPLPSFATVAHQAIQQDCQSQSTQSVSVQQTDVMMQDMSTDTITMLQEEAEGENTKPSSDNLEEAPSQQQQPFIFGSPRQQPLTNDSFMKRIDGFAIAKQLEELQRRTGTASSSSSSSSMGLNVGDLGGLQKGFVPRTASNGNLQGGNNHVRFDDKHQKEFKMMDSIANHYAARRKLQTSDTPNKRTRTESADAVSALSRAVIPSTSRDVSNQQQNSVHRQASCPALSLSNSGSLSLNQQGRYAPNIPPRPKVAKSAAQQAQDRERIRNMQMGGGNARRAGRASVSPRKAVVNPSTRKMPPLPSTASAASSLSSNPTGTASKLFKSTLSSLKSFGSSSSLSSKAGSSTVTESTSSRNVAQTPQVSDFGTMQHRGPTVAGGSVTRPTIASLARQASRQNLDSLASPPPVATTASGKASNSTLRQALSPRTVSSDRGNVASPRPAPSTLEKKKKVSSLTAQQRSSPMKAGLDDSIAQARRIRAKKLGAQMQQSRTPSTATAIVKSPSKATGLSAGASTTGSVSARPAWR